MSSCRDFDPLIDEMVDGSIGDADRAALDAHLRGCARCRAEAAAIGAVVARARRLPRDMAPSADRWIELRRTLLRRPRPLVLAPLARWAAVILVTAALASAATLAVMRGPAEPTASPSVAAGPAPESMGAADARYVEAARELEAELVERRSTLSPDAIATIERNLRLIDQAIAETRAALSGDPDDAELARMLAASQEQKLDLLRRATRLSPAS